MITAWYAKENQIKMLQFGVFFFRSQINPYVGKKNKANFSYIIYSCVFVDSDSPEARVQI